MGFAVLHVEIPVRDLDRARAFYEQVFEARVGAEETIHGNRMAFFDMDEAEMGASAALCQGEVYRPTQDGVILYVAVNDIAAVLARATAAGGSILFGPEPASATLLVAEIGDSEGNRIALQQPLG